MKILLLSFLFSILIFIALCDGQMPLEAAQKACMDETKVTKQDLDEFQKSMPSDATPANIKCQLKCLMEKMGHMKNGIFDAEKALKDWKMIPELGKMIAIDHAAFPKCKNEKGANDCETAFKIYKCLAEFKA